MLLALAWRNLWRNWHRTAITMAALTLGVAGIIGLHSYRDNTFVVLMDDITQGLIGDLQVHGKGYQESPTIGTLVHNPVQVEAELARAVPGATTERRVIGAGLAGAKDLSAPVMVVGMVPQQNGNKGLVTIVSGRDVSAEAKREAVLGRDLARDLEVKEGDEVVLVSQAADGSVANDRYTVVGTATSSSAELDATAVLLNLKDAQDFFGLGDGVHQVVVRLPETEEDVTTPLATVRSALDLTTLEALSWGQMLPELKETMETKERAQHIVDVIVFLIVALGVFNAMTMSTFERVHEFGVLMSVGTRPRRILGMVLLESWLQGLIAFTLGLGIAAAVLYGIGTADLTKMMQGDVMGTRMPSVIPLGLASVAVWSAAITAFATVTVGGLVPAVRAGLLKPVEALRHR